MYRRKIYLSNEKIKEISIFEGFHNFVDLTNLITSFGLTSEDYYVIRFSNMLYGFFYNDWNELILGKDILYYTNLDSHICRRERKQNGFDFPYEQEDISGRCVPNNKVLGVANDLIRMDRMIAIYYCDNNEWKQVHPINEEIKFKNIINEFGKQFYRDFFFSRIEIKMYLKNYFENEFLEHLDKFYINGAFEINPFTWKVTLDNTKNTYYCSFYDTITKKPLCEMGGKYYKI